MSQQVKPAISTHNTLIKAERVPQVKQIVQLAQQLSLSHIGFSFNFIYDNPGIALKNTIVHDPHTIQPVKLALVLVESPSRAKVTYRQVVVDLHKPQLVKALKPLFRLKVPFVGYDLKLGIFCLWHLGLPLPATVWDCLVCEQAVEFIGGNARTMRAVVAKYDGRSKTLHFKPPGLLLTP